ncbi:putative Amino acid transporter AVT1A [Cocos nucifera]|nr:putative Amino acid transporter AVT1A [Cocos nucifera]
MTAFVYIGGSNLREEQDHFWVDLGLEAGLIPPSSFAMSTYSEFHIVVSVIKGLGMLSIPYALSQGGWLSLILLFVTAVICCYTGLLLQRCMDSNVLVKTYPDIGELAFGRKGRLIVATFMYLELYLVAIEFLILEGDNLEKLFPYTKFDMGTWKIGGKQGFVLLAALPLFCGLEQLTGLGFMKEEFF